MRAPQTALRNLLAKADLSAAKGACVNAWLLRCAQDDSPSKRTDPVRRIPGQEPRACAYFPARRLAFTFPGHDDARGRGGLGGRCNSNLEALLQALTGRAPARVRIPVLTHRPEAGCPALRARSTSVPGRGAVQTRWSHAPLRRPGRSSPPGRPARAGRLPEAGPLPPSRLAPPSIVNVHPAPLPASAGWRHVWPPRA